VRSRADLPTLPAHCPGVKVFWNEQLISELGLAAQLLQTYHSGVTAELLPGGDEACAAGTRDLVHGMTLEFVAVHFPFGAVFPKVAENAPPVWSNDAVVLFSQDMRSGHRRNWTDSHEIGTMTATAFNRWMDYPVAFARNNPGYELFDVWSHPVDPETRWFNASICTAFSVGALVNAYNNNDDGVDFSASANTLLYRNWIPMLTDRKPQVVDLGDPGQLKDVNAFYGTLGAVASQKIGSMLAFVQRLVAELRDGAFYVYDTPRKRYLKVALVRPYVGIVGMYQPIQLPWQQRLQSSCPVVGGAPAPGPGAPRGDSGSVGALSAGGIVALCVGMFVMGAVAAVAWRRVAGLRGRGGGRAAGADEYEGMPL
jgi:hypothetical protein